MFDPAPDDVFHQLQLRHGRALALKHLVAAGIDVLPRPGTGQTLARWRVLAAVAAHDLSLVKLFEGHTDALAILAELGGAPATPSNARWGTWCAEPPDARVVLEATGGGRVHLTGTKAWCSGAASVTHAIVSCWNAAGKPCLAAVTMDQPGVRVTGNSWHAVGMAASGSVDVRFEHAVATPIGRPGDYVSRPGFWQGGAGIAACWFGGALGIARTVHRRRGSAPDAHRLAHIGAIDTALSSAAALLRESAARIDLRPTDNAQRIALRTRLVVEQAANEVMQHAGRAVGAGPLCRDPRFAQAMADLPVFLRQSHAEHDLAALGRLAAEEKEMPSSWTL